MTKPSTLPTRDGLALHLRHWPTAPGASARGRILLVHGLGEHIGRHERLAAELNAQGWAVAGYDLRGHGRSEGAKGRVRKTDDMLSDLAAVIDSLRSELPKLPLLLLGH
ncbi:MAG TPA: alpha/beta fold hydrolase, partial [Methylibium sp.]